MLTNHVIQDFTLHDVSYGALTQLWAGTMPETLQHSGQVCVWNIFLSGQLMSVQFLVPYARLGKTKAAMYDPEVGERLWKYLQEQVKDQPSI